jgi:hypothetical protein
MEVMLKHPVLVWAVVSSLLSSLVPVLLRPLVVVSAVPFPLVVSAVCCLVPVVPLRTVRPYATRSKNSLPIFSEVVTITLTLLPPPQQAEPATVPALLLLSPPPAAAMLEPTSLLSWPLAEITPVVPFLLSLLDLAQVSETVETIIPLKILLPLLSSLLRAVVLMALALLLALLFPRLLLDPVKASETVRPPRPGLVLVTATTTLLMLPKPLRRHLVAAVALCLPMAWPLLAVLSLPLLLDQVTASARVATPLLHLDLATATATIATTLLTPPPRHLAVAAELDLAVIWLHPVVLFPPLLLDQVTASARVAMRLLHLDLDSAAATMTPTMLPRLQVAAAAEEASLMACFNPEAEARLTPTFPLSLLAPVRALAAGVRTAAFKGALVALKIFMYN